MKKSIALVDIRLFLYLHYHRKESILNVIDTIYSVSPLAKFTKIFFVYDKGKNPYIKDFYPDYKENRTEVRAKQTDAEKARYKQFSKEYNSFPDITKFFGTNIYIDGEADTMIEVLANKFSRDGDDVYIFSSDGDFNCMLSDPNITQVTAKGEVLDSMGVLAKKGVTPDQLLLSKCLAGDIKDNIIGIKKLGEIKDNKTGSVLKKLFVSHPNTEDLLDELQSMVDEGKRGMALPEDYGPTTVRELYEFNKRINTAFTFDDLTDEHKEEIKKQVNIKKTKWSEEDFNEACWEHFSNGMVIQPHVLDFYSVRS